VRGLFWWLDLVFLFSPFDGVCLPSSRARTDTIYFLPHFPSPFFCSLLPSNILFKDFSSGGEQRRSPVAPLPVFRHVFFSFWHTSRSGNKVKTRELGFPSFNSHPPSSPPLSSESSPPQSSPSPPSPPPPLVVRLEDVSLRIPSCFFFPFR